MRTTLVIADPVYERARQAAQSDRRPLSDLVTEAVEDYLVRVAKRAQQGRVRLELKTYSMGAPTVDLNNRDELNRRMDGEA